MKTILRTEQFAQFILAIFLFSKIGYPWWWFPLLIFLPDISLLGYFINPVFGSWLYNFFHFKVLSVGLYLIGSYFGNEVLTLIGIVLYGHSCLDRFFGFGLKYEDSFFNTHLNQIKIK